MKNLEHKVGWGTLAILGIGALLGMGKEAKAGWQRVGSFADFDYSKNESVEMKRTPKPVDNLMIVDPNTGVEDVVSKYGVPIDGGNDWDGEKWDMGFIKYDGGSASLVGYANNNNPSSNNRPGFEGWMYGNISKDLGDGNRPDEVVLLHDKNGDGFWYNTNTRELAFDQEDTLYGTMDILFNGIRGDTRQLPAYSSATSALLPKMTVKPRTDYVDLQAIGESWLREDCGYDNAYCNCGDWNGDGKVDMRDFARMANSWVTYNADGDTSSNQ